MKRFKKCWCTIAGEEFEDDDPIELARMILERAEDNEEILDRVLKAIANDMVEEIDDEDYLADCYNFQESLKRLHELNIRKKE